MASGKHNTPEKPRQTRVLKVRSSNIGHFVFHDTRSSFRGDWELHLSKQNQDAAYLAEAASAIRYSDLPVAFPTETVYGLGADATRSAAVQGIYNAKRRPSDNPLIVHIGSLSQLRKLLAPSEFSGSAHDIATDPIPAIYHPLVSRFWPGPLTILLPLPTPSPFAPEVTNSLPTVAVRMPSSRLALALIQLSGLPLAAPSANTSSKPSPTTAAHVLYDLCGRIDIILDGGPCAVGVESTVVDGLSSPPVILRPGGVSLSMLRESPGWENVQTAYKDGAETGVPRAPGMKYKHYAPTARVLLFCGQLDAHSAKQYLGHSACCGLLRTRTWPENLLERKSQIPLNVYNLNRTAEPSHVHNTENSVPEIVDIVLPLQNYSIPSAKYSQAKMDTENGDTMVEVWDIGLGPDTSDIARGLFSALRELDQKGVDVIFVEGIDGQEGDAAAAIMNRLRKAAEAEIAL
ncbi:hypothetical protein MMC21_001187 [Puttea exsequens]|nr:hypothetical protein [Puttea exsequens]